jgi:alpha-mannosidase
LLRDIELLATLASLCGDYKYPKETLELLWEDLCRNQFHDTLPGSSINLCVKDSDGKYREIQATGKELLDNALAALVTRSTGSIFVNTLHSTPRREVVVTKSTESVQQGFAIVEAPTGLTGAIITADVEPAVIEKTGDGFVLSNSTVSIRIAGGRIASIRDLALGRELIAQGRTAGFNIYEDHPENWE